MLKLAGGSHHVHPSNFCTSIIQIKTLQLKICWACACTITKHLLNQSVSIVERSMWVAWADNVTDNSKVLGRLPSSHAQYLRKLCICRAGMPGVYLFPVANQSLLDRCCSWMQEITSGPFLCNFRHVTTSQLIQHRIELHTRKHSYVSRVD